MNKKKKEDKNKDLDKEKINFLGEWNVLNPDPPVVKPEKEKFNFLGEWTALNPDPPVVKPDEEKKGKKK
ncbi:MAG: hypothetical protein ABRQ39_21085 [Candidatus Eremiobacterota bacterium]